MTPLPLSVEVYSGFSLKKSGVDENKSVFVRRPLHEQKFEETKNYNKNWQLRLKLMTFS